MPKARRLRDKQAGTRAPAGDAAGTAYRTPPSLAEMAACCEGRIPAHERIAARAREIWESRGRPAGEDLDIWIVAETDLIRAGA